VILAGGFTVLVALLARELAALMAVAQSDRRLTRGLRAGKALARVRSAPEILAGLRAGIALAGLIRVALTELGLAGIALARLAVVALPGLAAGVTLPLPSVPGGGAVSQLFAHRARAVISLAGLSGGVGLTAVSRSATALERTVAFRFPYVAPALILPAAVSLGVAELLALVMVGSAEILLL
jgi:hypothetical protein